MSVTIRIDTKGATAGLSALALSQLPFAISKALNDTGLQFQKAERQRFAAIFTERRKDFIEKQGVKRLGPAASKRNPSVTFGVDPKASFLDKFETGTPKRSIVGGNIAVPVSVTARKSTGIIPKINRPRQLIDRLGQRKGSRRVFILREQHGMLEPGIYQTTGTKGRGPLKRLYLLNKQVRTPRVLNFVATFKQIVEQNWQRNFAAALTFAIRTAK